MTCDGGPPTRPTIPADRIEAVDILRGLALLGMWMVHFHARSTDSGGIDDVVRTLVWRLVESKSHGTFALLFGAGFAIQLRRAASSGAPFVGFYLRRLAVLALFGFAAHAFFGFNVLLGYALWGVPLFLIRRWSTPKLLATAVLSAASVPLYQLATTWYQGFSAGPDSVALVAYARQAEAAAVNGAIQMAETEASYAVLLGARLRHMAWFHAQPFAFLPAGTLALFIIGFLLVRHRVFEEVRAHHTLLATMVIAGVASWLADNWLLPMAGAGGFGILRDQWLMFSYVAAALLLLAHQPHVGANMLPFANAGRMALTNYLIQIAALDLLFSGYALGLREIRPMVGLAAALACFGIQAALSTLWLRSFRFGPAEWLWKSLTYGRWQPMRRERLAAVSQVLS